MERTIFILCILSCNIYISLAAQADCTTGTYWDGTNCVACAQGTYQDATQQTSCKNCAAGTSNANTGSTASSACVACTTGTWSTEGSSSCSICAAGYKKLSNGNCESCTGQGFQPSVGQSSCDSCPEGSTTTKTPAIASSECDSCTAGYFREGTTCTKCPVGSWSAAAATSCTLCTASRALSSTVSTGAKAVTECFCDKGYSSSDGTNSGTCTICAQGEYKDNVGDDSACKKCTAIKANSGTASAAVPATDSSFCVCSPGYYGTGTCTACPLGTFNAEYGQGACTKCLATGRTTTATAKTLATDCNACDAGYWGSITSTEACTPCALGTYKATADDGTTATTECANKCTTTASKPSSTTAALGAKATTDCLCMAGYYLSGTTCTICPQGQYKDTVADASSCTACSTGYTTFSTATSASSGCICDKGYYLTGGSCQQCPVATYQDAEGQDACKNCAAGYTTSAVGQSLSSACVCGTGYGGTSCLVCPLGTYKSTTGTNDCTACATERTTVTTGQTAVSSCVCKAGYYLNGATCTACAVGSYSSTANATACTSCPTGLTTTSTASSTLEDCVCAAGYLTTSQTTNAASNLFRQCAECSKGTYQSLTAQTSCDSCTSPLTTSSTGSTAVTSCIYTSAVGNFGNTTGTYPCAIGTYQNTTDQSSCLSCSTGSTTITTGSTSSSACVCTTGYAGSANSCTQCYYSTYQDTTGQTSCKLCSNNQITTTLGATASSSCVDSSGSTTTRVGKFTIISLTYSSDYGTEGTTNYMTLYNNLGTLLQTIYSNKSSNFARVENMKFSSGSVIAEYDIIFNGDADLTNTELQDALKNSLTSGNQLGTYTLDTSTIDVRNSGLGWAAILGIVLGSLAFIVIVIVLIVICCYYCNNRRQGDRYGGDRYSRGRGGGYGGYSNQGFSGRNGGYKNFDRDGRIPPTTDPGFKQPYAMPRVNNYPDSMGSEKGMNMPNVSPYHWRQSNGWPNYDNGQVTGRRQQPETGFDGKNNQKNGAAPRGRGPSPRGAGGDPARHRASQIPRNNNDIYGQNPYRAYQMDDQQGNLY